MNKLQKDFKIDVAAMKQRLLAGKITKESFKLDLTIPQITDLLTAAYAAEVEYRHRHLQLDVHTQDHITQAAHFLANPSPHFGLFLCGKHGNGKTTLVKSIASVFAYLASIGYSDIQHLRIIDAVETAQLINNEKLFKELKNKPCLALEDIGREPREVLSYGNALNPITDIIEHRYNEQLFTIITTNLNPKEIREQYGDRIADRFNEMMFKILYQNHTYRE